MTGQQILRVDVHDDAELTAWWEARRAGLAHDLGRHATLWQLEELRVMKRTTLKHLESELYSAVVDGKVVATAELAVPQLDNLGSADVGVVVVPEHRRRGHGSALLAAVETAARTHGRDRLTAMCTWPYPSSADGSGVAGVEFARRHGFTIGIGDVQRELTLPVDDALLQELAAEAADHTAGYEIRAWAGVYPDDLLESYVQLASRLMIEAPMGEMEWERQTTDLEAERVQERVQIEAGRTMYRTAAIAPDGAVAAYSDLALPAYDPSWVFQWGTLVDPAHRGHRLGTAVKVANLRLLQQDPRAAGRRVVTWNAEENDHMIGINRRLGFEPVCRGAELLKKAGPGSGSGPGR